MKLGTYITNKNLCEDTLDMCHVIKQVIPEFDIVVAIPRGGFIPASLIAFVFGKPITTPDLLLQNKYWWTTSMYVDKPRENRVDQYIMDIPPRDDYKILLVDDTSYNWFGLLHRTKNWILENKPKYTVYKVAPYCFERTKRNLDFYCKEIAIEHWFEKDLMIRKRGTAPVLCDMDGFLCDDSPCFHTHDPEEYLKSIRECKPYLIPHWKIDYIITGRLEKYRKETVEWLLCNGVKYDKLIMQEGNIISGTDHALYKSNVINGLHLPDGSIFIESQWEQAVDIYKRTGIQVICSDTSQLIGAADIGYEYHPAFKGYRKNESHSAVVIVKKVDEEGKKVGENYLFPYNPHPRNNL